MKSSNFLLDSLSKDIKLFDHPLIDDSKTKVCPNLSPNGAFTLAVELYDHENHYVVGDINICEGYNMPGLLVTFIPKQFQLRIENAYLKDEYQHFNIGTSFVKHLFNVSGTCGFNRVSLVADKDYNADTYWKQKHDFMVPDDDRPLYLERRI